MKKGGFLYMFITTHASDFMSRLFLRAAAGTCHVCDTITQPHCVSCAKHLPTLSNLYSNNI